MQTGHNNNYAHLACQWRGGGWLTSDQGLCSMYGDDNTRDVPIIIIIIIVSS